MARTPRLSRLIWLLSAGWLLCGSVASAQEEPGLLERVAGSTTAVEAAESELDEIEDFLETDRNSFTLARKTAGLNRLVLEAAYSFLDPAGEGYRHSYPEFVARYGVTDRIELRLGWNNESETGEADDVSDGIISNFFGAAADKQLMYGFKYQLLRQDGPRPDMAIVMQGHTPTGGKLNTTQPRFAYSFGWRLPNDWNLDTALWYGPDSDLGDHFNIWAPSVVVKVPLGRRKRWFTHVEYFSVMSDGLGEEFTKHFLDTGLHYFITPNWEVGTIVAFGLNDQSDNILVNVGFGIRF